jgi:hypothetical protein
MKYLLLKRAFNNFGDYLIFDRAKNIIKDNIKNAELIEADGSIPLDKQFDSNSLSKFSAIIIVGGPVIRNDLYPELYPLSEVVFEKKIPVFILGCGSKRFQNLERILPFSKNTDFLLRYVNNFGPIGCRDEYTKNYLDKLGYKTVLNGCPAWYNINHFGERIEKNYKIKKILFSVPGNQHFFEQFLCIINEFTKKNKNYDYYVSFNHGFTNKYKRLEKKLSNKNVTLLDMSKDIKKSILYNDMDLHIGFRVHAHIYFLSNRKPSIILAEDSRGIGVMNTLKTKKFIPGIKCWNDKSFLLKYKFYINKKLGLILFKPYSYKTIFKELNSKFLFLRESKLQEYNIIFKKMEDTYFKNTRQYLAAMDSKTKKQIYNKS